MKWPDFPWKLVESEYVEIYLPSVIARFFASLNGRRASHKLERDRYALAADETGVRFETLSTIESLLNETLVRLSGRKVEIAIEDGERITFAPDPSEKVFEVYLASGNFFCVVPSGAAQTICKVGGRDKCVFLSESANGRFLCKKFGPKALEILGRLEPGAIRASRIGSCALR